MIEITIETAEGVSAIACSPKLLEFDQVIETNPILEETRNYA